MIGSRSKSSPEQCGRCICILRLELFVSRRSTVVCSTLFSLVSSLNFLFTFCFSSDHCRSQWLSVTPSRKTRQFPCVCHKNHILFSHNPQPCFSRHSRSCFKFFFTQTPIPQKNVRIRTGHLAHYGKPIQHQICIDNVETLLHLRHDYRVLNIHNGTRLVRSSRPGI